jgi:hypothetical protein
MVDGSDVAAAYVPAVYVAPANVPAAYVAATAASAAPVPTAAVSAAALSERWIRPHEQPCDAEDGGNQEKFVEHGSILQKERIDASFAPTRRILPKYGQAHRVPNLLAVRSY